MPDTRCPYSDLPRSDCDHCRPKMALASIVAAKLREAGVDLPVTAKVEPAPPPPPAMKAAARPLRKVKPVDLSANRDHGLGLIDYVVELTEFTTTLEPFTRLVHNADGTITPVTERHRTTSTSLLAQLEAAIEGFGTGAGGSAGEKGVPLALDALDAYTAIDTGVTSWRRRLKLIDQKAAPLEPGPALQNLKGAVLSKKCARTKGGSVTLPKDLADPEGPKHTTWCCLYHHVEHDVRGWWSDARMTTGWDAPPFKPRNTCPLCGVRGSLRIAADANEARCVECRCTWEGSAQISLLASHIRSENGDAAATG